MTEYTIAVREKGKSGSWEYIGTDLRMHDTTQQSRPLSLENATLAKNLLVAKARQAGRPIDCRIVRLCKDV